MILVTGGTGWLGSRVVTALKDGNLPDVGLPDLTGGHRVRCLALDSEPAAHLIDDGVEVIRGSVTDPGSLKPFFAGAEGAILIHLAGVIHPPMFNVGLFDEVNHQGPRNVVNAAIDAGVRRAVIMSSNSPFGGNRRNTDVFTEESPYNPYMGYGRSKRKMEEMLKDTMQRTSSTEIVIVRAPWFYGPNQPARQTEFFSMIRQGRFPMVGNGRNRRSMGYVDNLTQGIMRAAYHEAAPGKAFWIADARPYEMREIISTVADVMAQDFGFEVRPQRLKLPGIASDVARLTDGCLQAVGVYQQKIHVLSELNMNIACSIDYTNKIIGYEPKIELREGMKKSIEWCLQSGLKL